MPPEGASENSNTTRDGTLRPRPRWRDAAAARQVAANGEIVLTIRSLSERAPKVTLVSMQSSRIDLALAFYGFRAIT
jgi:hypothetical protein